jgi:hypothetical protein
VDACQVQAIKKKFSMAAFFKSLKRSYERSSRSYA